MNFEKVERMISKVCKIVGVVTALATIVFMWLAWAGIIPIYLWVFITASMYSIYYAFSLLVEPIASDRAERRCAIMYKDKEQFIQFINKRFIKYTLLAAMTAIDDIKAYCKRNSIFQSDAEIKEALERYESITASFIKEKPKGEETE